MQMGETLGWDDSAGGDKGDVRGKAKEGTVNKEIIGSEEA